MPDLILGTWNPSTLEVEAGGLPIGRGQPGLFSYYKASQSYTNLPGKPKMKQYQINKC